MTKKQIAEYIKAKLASDSRWQLRALDVIYSRQTASERAIGVTTDANGIGFTGCDAEILSSFASQVRNGRTLSYKQQALLARKMPRYWRQILSVITPERLEAMRNDIVAFNASRQTV